MVDRQSRVVVAFVFLVLLLLFESTFEQLDSLTSPTERAALLELRSSLGLRSKEWPRKADPCSNWTGITCNNGSVIGINISGFRRTRIGSQNPQFAVDALTNFTHLLSFNASNFLLPGSIPDWFGQRLLTLQVLDLHSCSIIGVIPPNFGNLTNLTTLNLAGNILAGAIPSSLSQLLGLRLLDLSQNSLNGSIPVSLDSFKNLGFLDISSNMLSGSIPVGIGSLSKLQYLNVSNNSLSSSIPAQFGDLASLVAFDLSLNSLTGSVPADLRGLSSLQIMMIGNNMLTGVLPDNLFPAPSQLQIVSLRDNDFIGEVPGVLWSMPSLRLLDVSGNNFTGLLPNSSLNVNATATELYISQNMFYGGLTPILRRFNLTDLSGNYFQGRVPEYLNKSSLISNCLQNVSNQRTLAECSSFYSERGLTFDNFGQPNATTPPATESSGNSNRWWIILAGVLGGFAFIVLLILLVVLVLCARKRGTTNQRGVGVGPVPAGDIPPPPGVLLNFSSLGDAFTYQQLLQATGDFSDANLIKHGHSGDLFRGVLENGTTIVIKKIDLRSIKRETYLLELDFISKVSNARLVPLLGHCLENENEKFLVYKYMPNGDLSSSLYRKNNLDDDNLQSLDWITRLKIAIGAAEGLSYLHHECSPPLVHRDIQASSILLDDKFEVRLGSLSEVCAQEGETHQSRITRLLRLPQSSEQGTSGQLTAICAYDVYCFGKVLLELVTGKLGISASGDAQMKDWLEQTLPYISIYDKELVTKILDPSLIVDEDLLEEVWAMAVVARSCLNPKPSRRPLMRYILKALENPLKVVREENSSSARLRTTSSRGSWNAALFGSWRQSSSDAAVIPATSITRAEGGSSIKQSGTTGSQGSNFNGGGEHSSSRRRHSKDIFPEPSDTPDLERQDRE
ncbi:LRR_1 domain-containing protein/Pkinase_Tyr domain-containing protein/LRRNT_2 domain-containing protein/LRR_4 domain-containing protein [Cephalotus follicularis]|uniref:LRR_1 domain-containing protein/Pkinase_Tyr domain-containing protein/LRRNT_2 domain-containing protein/LRR_4 domain-containing protein n=1 Tax=Cephalotus follicularis TaxID=3775 RepID=A0A1Q3CPJ3_CEPFO|nr:LRR_1 domain-containing protein/Pkinase_Tyr domain-containing protein/LRRNT_2 domain-containing protein/LRR_4 domain-containing protein [Cephalotus follicularis]